MLESSVVVDLFDSDSSSVKFSDSVGTCFGLKEFLGVFIIISVCSSYDSSSDPLF